MLSLQIETPHYWRCISATLGKRTIIAVAMFGVAMTALASIGTYTIVQSVNGESQPEVVEQGVHQQVIEQISEAHQKEIKTLKREFEGQKNQWAAMMGRSCERLITLAAKAESTLGDDIEIASKSDCTRSPQASLDKALDQATTVIGGLDAQSHSQLVTQIRSDAQLQHEPVKNGYISSSYGWREDPFSGKRQWHNGQDYSAPMGEPVYPMASGVVISAGKDGGFGKRVDVRHPSGDVSSYAHLSRIDVKEDDLVTPNSPIAAVGSTGRSTAPHLHVEVVKGDQSRNPREVIRLAEK